MSINEKQKQTNINIQEKARNGDWFGKGNRKII